MDGHLECMANAPCISRDGTKTVPEDCTTCDQWVQALSRALVVDRSSGDFQALSHRWSIALK